MKLVIFWVVPTLALFTVVYLIRSILVEDPNAGIVYALMALIFELVNAFIHPLLKLLSCPLIILTLGSLSSSSMGLSSLLAARIAEALGVGL